MKLILRDKILLTGLAVFLISSVGCFFSKTQENKAANQLGVFNDNKSAVTLSSKRTINVPSLKQSLLKNDEINNDYTIGHGDLLQINVLGSTEFNTKVSVPKSGYISVPYIGSVVAGGTSVSELEFNITFLLSEGYLIDPQVNVFIEKYGSKKVFVVGSVNNPKVVILQENASTLLEIISMTGDFKKDAGDSIYIVRPSREIELNEESNLNDDMLFRIVDEVIIVKRKDLMSYRNPNANILIYPGDIVSVPESDFFFVMGAIEKPGAYQMEPGMTVLQAISNAGKFEFFANLKKLRIIRKNLATNEEYILKVNIKRLYSGKDKHLLVESGDIFVVGEDKIKKLAQQSNQISMSVINAFANAFMWEQVRKK